MHAFTNFSAITKTCVFGLIILCQVAHSADLETATIQEAIGLWRIGCEIMGPDAENADQFLALGPDLDAALIEAGFSRATITAVQLGHIAPFRLGVDIECRVIETVLVFDDADDIYYFLSHSPQKTAEKYMAGGLKGKEEFGSQLHASWRSGMIGVGPIAVEFNESGSSGSFLLFEATSIIRRVYVERGESGWHVTKYQIVDFSI